MIQINKNPLKEILGAALRRHLPQRTEVSRRLFLMFCDDLCVCVQTWTNAVTRRGRQHPHHPHCRQGTGTFEVAEAREGLAGRAHQWFLGHVHHEQLRPGMTLTCSVNFWPKIIYADSTAMPVEWEQLFNHLPFNYEVD